MSNGFVANGVAGLVIDRIEKAVEDMRLGRIVVAEGNARVWISSERYPEDVSARAVEVRPVSRTPGNTGFWSNSRPCGWSRGDGCGSGG
jgi:hypothetical protein